MTDSELPLDLDDLLARLDAPDSPFGISVSSPEAVLAWISLRTWTRVALGAGVAILLAVVASVLGTATGGKAAGFLAGYLAFSGGMLMSVPFIGPSTRKASARWLSAVRRAIGDDEALLLALRLGRTWDLPIKRSDVIHALDERRESLRDLRRGVTTHAALRQLLLDGLE